MDALMKEPTAQSLVDFYNAWPDLRPNMVQLSKRGDLTPDQLETLNWMILLIDRLGFSDIPLGSDLRVI
jgi:hypothetical protein